jgi:branched-chain amino acid transport system permease protein
LIDYTYYLLLGLGAGAIIAALAVGLVVSYQGSGVVNFAHGAVAMWAPYVYLDLRSGSYPFPIPGLPDRYRIGHDVGFRWAFILSVVTAALMGLFTYFLVFRPLRRAPALARVVASVGLMLVMLSLVERRFGTKPNIRVKPILERKTFTIARDLTIPRDGIWLAVIVLLITLAFWLMSRYSNIGLATRAAAESEKGAVLLGYSPDRLAAVAWVAASTTAGLVAVLAAPLVQLSPTVFTFGFLVPALGASLIGKFRNLWPTALTGLGIGMVQSTFTKMQSDISWFPHYGAREGLPFLLIIVTMFVLGERLPDRGSVDTWKLPSVPPANVTAFSVGVPTVAALLGLLLLGPLWRAAIMSTVIAALLSLSLVVVTGFGGQTSLAQMSFAGIAGFALSKLATSWGVPFPVAPFLAALAAMLFGVLVGLPALRVRGTNLAIVTVAGAVAVGEFVFKNPQVIGDAASGGAKVPNPKLGPWDFGLVLGNKTSRPIFGVFLLAVLVVVALAVTNLRRSASGRRMLAMRGNERAAAAGGINVSLAKLELFALSSFIAGAGGALTAYRFGSVSDASYGILASLTILAFAYLGGITSVSGAVTAGIVGASGVAFYSTNRLIGLFRNGNGGLGTWEVLIGGVLLIFTAVQNPEGIAGAIRQQAAAKRAAAALKANSTVIVEQAAARLDDSSLSAL